MDNNEWTSRNYERRLVDAVSRTVAEHAAYFYELRVAAMSDAQKKALYDVLDREVDREKNEKQWRRRSAIWIGLAGFVGALLPQLPNYLPHH